jgi:peroxiredoxin
MRMVRLLCAVLLLASLSTPAAAAEKFKPFKLKTLDGTEMSLADTLGKATLVVFFYPTCPYCNAAFPAIQKLHDAYKDYGLTMVWINVLPDEEKLIGEWRVRHGYTVPILLGKRSVQNDYKLVMTPTHYLLDANGVVLSKHAGYTAGDENSLEREIRQALGR